MIQNEWPFPGSRWWKFDFHTHTPASHDTEWYKKNEAFSPEQWLLEFMKMEVDCVAVTDHNSGEWIDKLKAAYKRMKARSEDGSPDAFRELTLFPGVELSVNGGIHILAIFDPSASKGEIDSLLGKVGYDRKKIGECDSETKSSIREVIEDIIELHGIPIAAHADAPKGLCQTWPDSNKSVIDSTSLKRVMEERQLLGLEWIGLNHTLPEIVKNEAQKLPLVLGSDCHNLTKTEVGTSKYTWVKMETPNLEGLRLALIDGNGVSIKRGDDTNHFEPFRQPQSMIEQISIQNARYMGNGSPQLLTFSPLCNAVIGGRGTGKSTIVHFIRLATQRNNELQKSSSSKEEYNRFSRIPKDKNDSGVLRVDTGIEIYWLQDNVHYKITAKVNDTGEPNYKILESCDGSSYRESRSQTMDPERFPLRILSQGQIGEMAEKGQALLNIIDESAHVGDLKVVLVEARRNYFSKMARLREIEGKLARRSEIERKLEQIESKLNALAISHFPEVYCSFQNAQGQRREVAQTAKQLHAFVNNITSLSGELILDDWPKNLFDQTTDADILLWRTHVDDLVHNASKAMMEIGQHAGAQIAILKESQEYSSWSERLKKIEEALEKVKIDLNEKGISDPKEIDDLLASKQQLEIELREQDELEKERLGLAEDTDLQKGTILQAREAITERRRAFIAETIRQNQFVRIEIVPFGNNADNTERDLRELIDATDERFSDDVKAFTDLICSSNNGNRLEVIEDVKKKLLGKEVTKGYFKNYLDKKLDRPEFLDYVTCWYPEDDLNIEYSREGNGTNWKPILQGSKGQRSAALLAFLLSFGQEPIVLDQPEDDLDNHLIYDLIVAQIRENKLRRQLIIVTHNPNIVVNGDAEMIFAMNFQAGQCKVAEQGSLQKMTVRSEVCRIMEGGVEALALRWARLGKEL
ncbi:MAG: hypothetical protein BWX81_00857 [Spirochaetes bacterium ADurb.Bin110]|nr:MAG: hypothetical protein BWX81_00857 [Spirochaetes bacterium ADurb.Bin110]